MTSPPFHLSSQVFLHLTDVRVPGHLQVDDGCHCPQVDLDVGVDVLYVDLAADEALTAESDIDAGLFELADDLDVMPQIFVLRAQDVRLTS